MSNIYIQEPSTTGKVLLKTTVGDIEIELWARECPKTCRNFIQLCMEGYYNGTTFHRIVKGFIVQGGDPSGDGTGGESIYGEPFKDEFHSRLRYSRRGLVGMANSDKDDNGSQFFFTMAPTPELQNKNTLFGKVTGDTVFNMLKLEDGLVDHNERPLYAQKIIRAEILSNPFDDIVPRMLQKDDVEKKEKKKSKEKGVKNFGLLSFGEEAEEDEEETNDYVQRHSGKAKSMHDMVDDPKLSKQAVKITKDEGDILPGDNSVQVKEEEDDADQRMHRIKSKLKQRSSNTEKNVITEVKVEELENSDSEDENLFMKRDREEKIQSQKKKEEIRQEILLLKKQYQKDKKIKEEFIEKTNKKQEVDTNVIKNPENNEFIKNFIEEKEKYSGFKSKIPKKGATREDFTLNLLSKFRSKLDALKQKRGEMEEDSSTAIDDKMVEKEIQGDDWLAHTLKFQEIVPVLAKDASTKGDDWYDAYDPRNPLNKRKRGESGTSKSNSSAKRSR